MPIQWRITIKEISVDGRRSKKTTGFCVPENEEDITEHRNV